MTGSTRKLRSRIVASPSVRAFFHDSVESALENQRVDASGHAVHYVVNMLTLFTRSEHFFEETPEGCRLRPLANMLADATNAGTVGERDYALQRLGDVALFVAGFFPDFLVRKLVDVGYYVRMGGNAYGALADNCRYRPTRAASAEVFDELSEKFPAFVDVIGEISDQGRTRTSKDILRLYELWLETGSRRLRAQLEALGVQASDACASRQSH